MVVSDTIKELIIKAETEKRIRLRLIRTLENYARAIVRFEQSLQVSKLQQALKHASAVLEEFEHSGTFSFQIGATSYIMTTSWIS